MLGSCGFLWLMNVSFFQIEFRFVVVFELRSLGLRFQAALASARQSAAGEPAAFYLFFLFVLSIKHL